MQKARRRPARVAGARGLSGDTPAYLRDLVEHLREEGSPDAGMERLLDKVEALELASR